MSYIEEKLVVSIRYPLTSDFKPTVITNCEDTSIERISFQVVESKEVFNPTNGTPPLELILKVSANIYNVSIDGVVSKSRDQEYVYARYLFSYVSHRFGYHFQDIADKICRNRTMIYHYMKNVRSELKFNNDFKYKYKEVLTAFGVK